MADLKFFVCGAFGSQRIAFDNGFFTLSCASERGYIEIVELLIAAGQRDRF